MQRLNAGCCFCHDMPCRMLFSRMIPILYCSGVVLEIVLEIALGVWLFLFRPFSITREPDVATKLKDQYVMKGNSLRLFATNG